MTPKEGIGFPDAFEKSSLGSITRKESGDKIEDGPVAESNTTETAFAGSSQRFETPGSSLEMTEQIQRPGIRDVAAEELKRRSAAAEEADKKKAVVLAESVVNQRFESDLNLLTPVPDDIEIKEHSSLEEQVINDAEEYNKKFTQNVQMSDEEKLHGYIVLGRAAELSAVTYREALKDAQAQPRLYTRDEVAEFGNLEKYSVAETLKFQQEALDVAENIYKQQRNQNFVGQIVVSLKEKMQASNGKVESFSESAAQLGKEKEGFGKKLLRGVAAVFKFIASFFKGKPKEALKNHPKGGVSLTRMKEVTINIPPEVPEPVDRSTNVVAPEMSAEDIAEAKKGGAGYYDALAKIDSTYETKEQTQLAERSKAQIQLTEFLKLGTRGSLTRAEDLIDSLVAKSKSGFDYLEGFTYEGKPANLDYLESEIKYLRAAALNMEVEGALRNFKGGYSELKDALKPYIDEAQVSAPNERDRRKTVIAGILKNKMKDPIVSQATKSALKELLVTDFGFVGFRRKATTDSAPASKIAA